MQYLYTNDQNWEDYSAGRVFHNFPGYPAFPVRLASELFQRAYAYWENLGGDSPCSLFDPCCGGAYHLAMLGVFHGDMIERMLASDMDAKALELAELNLRLMTKAGLQQRTAEIERMIADYGKDSHRDALQSAWRIQSAHQSEVPFTLFQADALQESAFAAAEFGPVDIVFSDVPYGLRSAWQGDSGAQEPLERLLENLLPLLKPESVVIIAADKAQKIRHPAYERLEKFSLGKRQAALMRRLNEAAIG